MPDAERAIVTGAAHEDGKVLQAKLLLFAVPGAGDLLHDDGEDWVIANVAWRQCTYENGAVAATVYIEKK
ncbi:MAG: hypothetical protein JST54_34685 [Deltaproteobacteria bacterium]|nr:hypothetical protein [Deltaproteobacteria bacterium]